MVKAGAVPDWWLAARSEIMEKDESLRGIISDYQEPPLSSKGDLFATLIKSIVGQQISVIAASAVWGRFAIV